jgi:tRNA-specific 2-thiouridylase
VGQTRRKVLVAMSGGVDSSVAAAILQHEGNEVVGCFMRLGSPGERLDDLIPATDCDLTASQAVPSAPVKIGHQGCCSINDAADARMVAAKLDIPLYVCNFKKDFGRVIDYFVDEYASGRTPNPCVRCNDWLKFGKLHEYARQIGADIVASGHYARIEEHHGEPSLKRGLDESKDQSYVLFGVPRAQLRSMAFPIGQFPKSRVREMAREFGLDVHDKPDSQEICFVPDNDYAGLVERRRPGVVAPGKVIDARGHVVGEHRGQHRFTVGQRRGLSISLGHPIYVVSKDAQSNTVTVGERADLECVSCQVGEANWLTDPPNPGKSMEVWAKYRYNTEAVRARVEVSDAGTGLTPSGRDGRFIVRFEESQQAVAPGQAMVLYDVADPARVFGGGWIEATCC